MKATRRDVLAGLGAGLGASLAGCSTSTVSGVVSTPDPNSMEQELGAGFEKLIWQEGGSAEIQFSETHGMDGFYIGHESDDADEAIASCDAPRYGGTVTVPLIQLLTADGYDYPSRRFKLIGGEGGFMNCSEFANISNQATFGTLGTTYFTVPERFEL